MTPGNNGEQTPSAPQGDDDPFGYLYADGQASGAAPPSGGGYGYPGPRSSYHQVRAVGERQYGQQAQRPQSGYGYPPQAPAAPSGYGYPPQQQGHGVPSAHYAAPEAQPGVTAPIRQAPPAPPAGRRGPNTKGLLIGAVAVVAVVALGIGAAMLTGPDDDGDDDKAGPATRQSESAEPTPGPTKKKDKPDKKVDLPETEAKALKLEGGTTTASDVAGAESSGGVYVAGFDKVGARVTWTVHGVPKSGTYKLWVTYGVPGEDADATVVVNGTKESRPLRMDNFARAPKGDWAKGWTSTWALVRLNKGTNTLSLACEEGNHCGANLDQFRLAKG
ncbi:CBM35 domain-containing protein [Streptomyces sp. CC224B]|uniref:CBM35 domain-containing protein n=1 Tax=Streptomyces sp. CC224B TaxID=3044571 RepID=UPI0024A7BC8B|nr:CBM35 domain-containing protein [Streptomyces sp. CC224B]